MDVISKVDDTIDLINHSDIVKRLSELKEIMDNDLEIQKLLSDFNIVKNKYSNDSIITEELSNAKECLYNHPIVAEYRKLYSELNRSFVKFNKDISSLINMKTSSCGRSSTQ